MMTAGVLVRGSSDLRIIHRGLANAVKFARIIQGGHSGSASSSTTRSAAWTLRVTRCSHDCLVLGGDKCLVLGGTVEA